MVYSDFKDFFIYDENTGSLRWSVNRQGHTKKGDLAGNVFKNGSGKSYRSIKFKGRHYLAHRVCWLMHYKSKPPECIDHINGDGLDNRIENLRSVTRSENQRNMKVSARSKTGIMGVSWDKRSKRWCARIKNTDKKTIHIGYFKDFFEAACARKSAELINNYHQNHGQNRPL